MLISHSVVSETFATPWTIAHQAPLSMGFPRQEHWSRLPVPSSADFPDPGIKPVSPVLAGGLFTTEPPGKHLWPTALRKQKRALLILSNLVFQQQSSPREGEAAYTGWTRILIIIISTVIATVLIAVIIVVVRFITIRASYWMVCNLQGDSTGWISFNPHHDASCNCCYSHSTDEQTEAQRSYLACPKSQFGGPRT